MTKIQAYVFTQKLGWHWEQYLTVRDTDTNRTLRALRRNNPGMEFRVDEIESDAEYQQHQRHADLFHCGKAAA
jgi:hypothetical protein